MASTSAPIGPEPDDLILWDVVEEHLDEAEFLFEQWLAAFDSPTYTLMEFGKTLEPRLEAHLDGLLVGGPSVFERLLLPELAKMTAMGRSVAAALVLLQANEAHRAQVLEATAASNGPLRAALRLGVELSGATALDAMVLERCRASSATEEKAIWLTVLTQRGVDPGMDLTLHAWEDSEALCCAILRAGLRFGRADLASVAESVLWSSSREVRECALSAALAFGSRAAWKQCLERARERDGDRSQYLHLIACFGSEAEHRWLVSELEKAEDREHLLWALGTTGTIRSGDACLPFLRSDDERLAKSAAEALAWIGGFNLEKDVFVLEPGEEDDLEALPPLEEDLELDLSGDGVDDLPLPDPEAIERWWRDHRDRLGGPARLLLGRLFSPSSLRRALEVAPLWRRHDLAMEITIRSRGKYHISTRAFSARQRRELGSLQTWEGM